VAQAVDPWIQSLEKVQQIMDFLKQFSNQAMGKVGDANTSTGEKAKILKVLGSIDNLLIDFMVLGKG
jgi:hypothetical protein